LFIEGRAHDAAAVLLGELDRADSIFTPEEIRASIDYMSRFAPPDTRWFRALAGSPRFLLVAITKALNRNDVQLARPISELLRSRKSLLTHATLGEEFQLALLRASLLVGDLEYVSGWEAPRGSFGGKAAHAESLWIQASAAFLTGDMKLARARLEQMLAASSNDTILRFAALQALVAVHWRAGDIPEAILRSRQAQALDVQGFDRRILPRRFGSPWFETDWLGDKLDAFYLMEIVASDDDLEGAGRLATEAGDAATARLIDFERGLRLARERRYAELASESSACDASARACLAYGAALMENADHVFFAGRFWEYGFQLIAPPECRREEKCVALPPREPLEAAERRLRDAQEERWHAYRVLEPIVQNETNGRELRYHAALLALRALDRIKPERFGREEEIVRNTKRMVTLAYQLRPRRRS
jgi:hypothetical protein